MNASIRKPQTEVTDQSFGARDKKITSSITSNQDLLVSQPAKTEHDPALWQQQFLADNLSKTSVAKRLAVDGVHLTGRG